MSWDEKLKMCRRSSGGMVYLFVRYTCAGARTEMCSSQLSEDNISDAEYATLRKHHDLYLTAVFG